MTNLEVVESWILDMRSKDSILALIKRLKEGELEAGKIAQPSFQDAGVREALEYSLKVQNFAQNVHTGAQDRELSLMEIKLREMTEAALKQSLAQPAQGNRRL